MPSAIAKRIKEIRKALGPWPGKILPRTRVAEALGIDPATVKRWEGGSIPDPENLAKLARFAGCDIDWLLTGQGRPPEGGAMERQGGKVERSQGGTGKHPPVAETRPGAQYGRRPLPVNVDLARYVAERAIELFVDLADRPAADLLPAVEEWEKVVRETYAPEAVEALRPLRHALEARAARERKKGRGTGT